MASTNGLLSARTRPMRRVLLVSVLLCFPAHAVIAQQTDSVKQLFDRAHRGNWWVRVQLLDSSRFEGRVPRLVAGAATVGRGSVPFEQVASIERRTRVGGGGRQVGIATGLLTGAFAGAFYSAFCESECSALNSLLAGLTGFGFGFATGAFFG